jgi:UDPglucose 6-dehydrogenase
MRFAPSLDIVTALQQMGATIHAYDPHSMGKAKECLSKVSYFKDAYSACRKADCAVVLTEWDEFKELDLAKLKKLLVQPVVVDGRNIYDPVKMRQLGFRYFSVGRPQ